MLSSSIKAKSQIKWRKRPQRNAGYFPDWVNTEQRRTTGKGIVGKSRKSGSQYGKILFS